MEGKDFIIHILFIYPNVDGPRVSYTVKMQIKTARSTFEFDTYYIPSGLKLYLDLDYAIQ